MSCSCFRPFLIESARLRELTASSKFSIWHCTRPNSWKLWETSACGTLPCILCLMFSARVWYWRAEACHPISNSVTPITKQLMAVSVCCSPNTFNLVRNACRWDCNALRWSPRQKYVLPISCWLSAVALGCSPIAPCKISSALWCESRALSYSSRYHWVTPHSW